MASLDAAPKEGGEREGEREGVREGGEGRKGSEGREGGEGLLVAAGSCRWLLVVAGGH